MKELWMRFPEGKKKALTLSYDDGVEQDARLVDILDRYGIRCTFNLNSGLFAPEGTVYPAGTIHRRMTREGIRKLFAGSDHEIAVHTLHHPFLEQLPPVLVSEEIIGDRKNLEAMFGKPVRGMAYPYGTYSDTVVSLVQSAGIAYARGVESSGDFSLPADWLRLKPTCHHNDPRLFELADRFLGEKAERASLLFYLWGHSYEFERDDNWDVIETFCEKMSGKEEIWYASNLEIREYTEACEQLRFSADGSFAQNPAACDLWLERDGVLYRIPAGETVRF